MAILTPSPRGFEKHEAQAAIEEWAEAKERTDRLWQTVLEKLAALQESPAEGEKP